MSEKVYPNITVVDEHDNVLGYMQLFDAIAAGHLRRAASVFIFNEAGEVLLQKRAATVLEPNLLDYSSGGHVDEGEAYEEAMRRELQEELGISPGTLELITPPFRTKYFFISVYKTIVNKHNLITPNIEEVSELLWMKFDDFVYELEHNPHKFASSVVDGWSHLHDKI
jgi:isopentenyl-diphosphate delta-isomerase